MTDQINWLTHFNPEGKDQLTAQVNSLFHFLNLMTRYTEAAAFYKKIEEYQEQINKEKK